MHNTNLREISNRSKLLGVRYIKLVLLPVFRSQGGGGKKFGVPLVFTRLRHSVGKDDITTVVHAPITVIGVQSALDICKHGRSRT